MFGISAAEMNSRDSSAKCQDYEAGLAFDSSQASRIPEANSSVKPIPFFENTLNTVITLFIFGIITKLA